MKTSALLATLLTALSLSACGGSSSSAVCDEYEKAFADITKGVDAGTKDLMQKSFEQTKATLKDIEDECGYDDAGCKKAQPSRLRHAQHEVACRCRACNGQGVRQLRCNVVDMVAMRTGGRQDGGVGNRRTVVAAHRASHNGGHARDDQRCIDFDCHRGGNRQHNAKRSPACTCGKRHHAGKQEEDDGQEAGMDIVCDQFGLPLLQTAWRWCYPLFAPLHTLLYGG